MNSPAAQPTPRPALRSVAWWVPLVFMAFTQACAAVDEVPADEDLPEIPADQPTDTVQPSVDSTGTGSTVAESSICSNCVLYARSRQPHLPYGLTYWGSKVAIINSHYARPGCVAIIYTGSAYGHVAYVRDTSSSSVMLSEANWVHDACTRRTVPRSYSRFRGYWCP